MPYVIIFSIIIELEVFIILVDCIVCEMLKQVFHVSFCWLLISLCRKSCKSFFEQIYPQGVQAIHKHINSKIKFKSFYQIRFVYVLLCYVMILFLIIVFIEIVADENTSSLAISFRFEDVCLVRFSILIKVLLEFI